MTTTTLEENYVPSLTFPNHFETDIPPEKTTTTMTRPMTPNGSAPG